MYKQLKALEQKKVESATLTKVLTKLEQEWSLAQTRHPQSASASVPFDDVKATMTENAKYRALFGEPDDALANTDTRLGGWRQAFGVAKDDPRHDPNSEGKWPKDDPSYPLPPALSGKRDRTDWIPFDLQHSYQQHTMEKIRRHAAKKQKKQRNTAGPP